MQIMPIWFVIVAVHVAAAQWSCSCCPTCAPCPQCGGIDHTAPAKPNRTGQFNARVKPLISCPLNCYGDATTPARLPGGRTPHEGMQVGSRNNCRAYCMASDECEAVVYGKGWCYGKRDVRLAMCKPGSEDWTTDFISQMPFGQCVIMGDPHILSFDNPNGLIGDFTQLQAGVYTLVKGRGLEVQGRFTYTKLFPAAAVLTGIAATGSLMGGHKLVMAYVGPPSNGPNTPRAFKTTWDGVPILNNGIGDKWRGSRWMSAELGIVNTSGFNWRAIKKVRHEELVLPSVVIQIEPKTRFYLLPGNQSMNAVLSMRKLIGKQSGYCGNFNCDPVDDSWEKMEEDLQPIQYPKSLFAAFALTQEDMQKMGERPRLQDCTGARLEQAYESCRGLIYQWQQECVFDACAAGGSKATSLEVGRADRVTIAVAFETRQKWAWLGPLKFLTSGPAAVLGGATAVAGIVMLVCGFALGMSFRDGSRARKPAFLLETEDTDPNSDGDEVQALLGSEAYDHELA